MRKTRKILRLFLLVIVPLAAIILGGHLWVKSTRYVTTENAYVKAHHLAVSADIDGRAIRVPVKENDMVKPGDILFQLDPEPYYIDVATAEAEIAGIRNTIAALRAEYREAQAERADARQEISYYSRVYERQRKLSARGIASRAKHDEAERNLTKARQASRTINQKIQRVLAQLGGKDDLPVERHPLYREAVTKRDRAALNLRRTRVVAPAAGTVGRVTLQEGEYVEEGKAVIPIILAQETWVEANLKETQLTHVKPGQIAIIIVDAYPDHEWKASVKSISPSTGAELSVLPPQNASGNWVKVVQRVPVRLEIKQFKAGLALRAGMTVSVSIDTERDRSLFKMIDSAFARMSGTEDGRK
ncbi:MAG: HlyD family secretion protein [Rhodospirillaceae bacterium]|jgi:membrane fusion protein, multidrug efflux system|nr:HlyD family secretion protein [Rhodospirillaceae bacterium]